MSVYDLWEQIADQDVRLRGAYGLAVPYSPALWNPFELTCTYASGTSFTVARDGTGILEIGDRIRLKQGGSFLYYEVMGVSYSAPNTTVTVSGTTALTNTTITDVYFCKMFGPFGSKCRPPKGAVIWHDESIATNGNAIARYCDNNQVYATLSQQNTAAINDAFSNRFYIAAGTYNLFMWYRMKNDNGILTVYIDGVSIGTMNCYGGTAYYNVSASISGFTIPYSGYHKFEGKVLSKSASSSGYWMPVTVFWIWPSAD
jgi:hypothetical protein